MNRKKIGIPGWNIAENSFGVTKAYLEFISYFGTPIILTPHEGFRKDIDLLILPGGKDIDTSRYNAIPGFYTGDSNQILEYFDKHVLPDYINSETPIFGICRGFQSLNVIFNGSLTQHYIHAYSKDRDELVHKLDLVDDLIAITTTNKSGSKSICKTIETNSMHHQCVFDHNLGDNLIPTLKHSDGVIEGIRHKSLPIFGVQYHPEELYDKYSVATIKYLLNYKNSPTYTNKLLKVA